MGFACGGPRKGPGLAWQCRGGGRPRNTARVWRHHLPLSDGSHPSLIFYEQDVYPPRVLKHSFIWLGSFGLVCRAQASRTQASWGCAVPGGAFGAAEPFVPVGCSRPALAWLDQGPGWGGRAWPPRASECLCWLCAAQGCLAQQLSRCCNPACICLPSLGPGSRRCLPGGWGTFSFVQKPLYAWPWDLPGLISEETCITISFSCCILML